MIWTSNGAVRLMMSFEELCWGLVNDGGFRCCCCSAVRRETLELMVRDKILAKEKSDKSNVSLERNPGAFAELKILSEFLSTPPEREGEPKEKWEQRSVPKRGTLASLMQAFRYSVIASSCSLLIDSGKPPAVH